MPKKQQDIISTTEAAKLLGIDPRTVQRRAISGDLPIVSKLRGDTGAYLFNRADVLALLTPAVRPVDDPPTPRLDGPHPV